jgi:hypothetical protein
MAPAPRLCAAPANSDSTRTPALSDWQATYSYDTRFMPSRRLLMSATSGRAIMGAGWGEELEEVW